MPKSHTPDWSSLNQYAPEWSEVEAACQLSEPGEVVPHAVSSPKDRSPSPEDIDSKQSSSSSSSDTDTDGEQLQEVTDSWFRHLAHLVQGSKNGRFIPWCREPGSPGRVYSAFKSSNSTLMHRLRSCFVKLRTVTAKAGLHHRAFATPDGRPAALWPCTSYKWFPLPLAPALSQHSGHRMPDHFLAYLGLQSAGMRTRVCRSLDC